ncbi:MAG: hypothetical protein JNK49_15435 [Planctomycetes bacterium]|nr:hypothetical protein [Planctomycetota bacterium]
MTPARRLLWLWPAAAALLWFWPVLGHWFRSDDLLTVYYWDRDGAAVRWDRVFEEWVRPWFGVRDLYRPLVSLSFGLDYCLSTAPFGFHLTNVLLLGGTAVAVALAARRLAPGRPFAALAAALVVVLHPAAVEPGAWIAARTTGLQVFWSAVAYWSFLRWRDGAAGLALPLSCTALACASKEGAVLLPLSLVWLDLLRGGRPRVRAHLPFALLVAGCLVWRRVLLGVFTTAEAGHGFTERLPVWWQFVGQLLVPPGVDPWWCASGAALLVGLAVAGWWRAGLAMLWALCLLTPGTSHWRGGSELAGRFVFDAVPALGLAVAVVLAAVPQRPVLRWLCGLVVGAWLLALALASRAELARYGADDQTVRAAQRELLAAARDAGPGRPYGVIGLPGLPLLQPETWGFLTLRPFAERDLPVVGLTNVLARNGAAPELFGDTSVVHLLVAEGAGVGRWDEVGQRLVPVVAAAPGTVDFVRDPAQPGRFLPPRLLPPTAVAQLEIRTPEPVAEWRIEILGNLAGDYAAAPMRAKAAAGVAWCSTVQVLPWLVAATFGGGPAGVELHRADAELPPPVGTTVRAHARLARVELGPGPKGSVERAGLGAVLALPELAAVPFRRYLLLPTGVWSWQAPGGARDLPVPVRDQVTFAADLLGGCAVAWAFVEVGAGLAPVRAGAFGSTAVR